MQVNESEIWASVCGELEVAMSSATFGYYINPCFIKSIIEVDAERVIVQLASPSAFHLNQIDNRYYGQIKQAMEKQLERKVELALVVGSARSSSATALADRQESKTEQVEEIREGLFSQKQSDASETKGLFSRYTFDSF